MEKKRDSIGSETSQVPVVVSNKPRKRDIQYHEIVQKIVLPNEMSDDAHKRKRGRPPMGDAPSVSVSIRFPHGLDKEVGEYCQSNGITRSQLVVDAVSYYISSKKCLECGSINPSGGVRCSVCGSCLFDEKDILSAMMRVAEKKIPSMGLPFGMDGGYNHIYYPCIDKSSNPPLYYLEYAVQTPQGIELKQERRESVIYISKEEIDKELQYVDGMNNDS